MRRSVVEILEALSRTRRAEQANLAVLVEVETIKQVRRTADLPIQPSVNLRLTEGFAQGRVQCVKGSRKGFSRSDVLFGPLSIDEPEQLVLYEITAKTATELFALEWRWSIARQRGCCLIASE